MMRRLLLSVACLASLTTYAADTTPVWRNPSVNQQNREPRRADFFAFESIDKAQGDKSASARYQSMEGLWKFCFVKNHQDAPKDFYTLKYDDSKWVDFPVPGLFELNGYGDRIYKNIGYARPSKRIPHISVRRTTIRVLIVAVSSCLPTGKGWRCSST